MSITADGCLPLWISAVDLALTLQSFCSIAVVCGTAELLGGRDEQRYSLGVYFLVSAGDTFTRLTQHIRKLFGEFSQTDILGLIYSFAEFTIDPRPASPPLVCSKQSLNI